MGLMAMLGQVVALEVKRRAPPGLYLGLPGSAAEAGGADDNDTVLLPNREAPQVPDGTALEVFLYLDSEDRLIASVKRPAILLGEVAFLLCRDRANFGAFFDWGLTKELLVPNALMTRDVRVGDRMPVGLIVDDTGRLAGTMRVSEMLDTPSAARAGEWVQGQLLRVEPGIGTFFVLGKRSIGLVPEQEPHGLRRGDEARLRVAKVHGDGKVELSLRGLAHEVRGDDGEVILAALRQKNPPRLGDHSDPDEIRTVFGLSKKAFKRAVGGLLKAKRVVIGPDGVVRLAT